MPEITIALRVADDHRVTVATTMPQPQVGAPLCVTQSLALDAINAIKRNPRCAGVEWGSSRPQTICRTLGVLRTTEEQAA